MAGYSGTPLVKKLGIKPGCRLALLQAPDDFDATLGELPAQVIVVRQLRTPCDVLLFFTKSRTELQKQFQRLKENLDPDGGLWIAWPKKASGVATDLTEDVIRDTALTNGLVDNKVCAIDETWSGLRLVVRVKDRPKR
jgi:Protein of unknown function (DUF3052)